MDDPKTVLDQLGPWRIVEPYGAFPNVVVEFRLSDGNWIFPDCSYSCIHCGECLGCVRKMAAWQAEDAECVTIRGIDRRVAKDQWYLIGEELTCGIGGQHHCIEASEID